MINEKHNSNIDWKNKLEELEASSDAPFNKETAWNKLHERLEKKSDNRKFFWYWITAASLLLLLVITFIQPKKEKGVIVKNEIVQPGREKLIPPSVTNRQIDSVENIGAPLIENKVMAITHINKKKKIISVNFPGIKKENQLSVSVSNPDTAVQHSNTTQPAIDTAFNIAATFTFKKKLKVVHINETGEPVEVPPDVAHNTIIHSFQFKLAGEEVYINHPEKSNTSGITILKSKNSPN